jgi:WD40 repeat protein
VIAPGDPDGSYLWGLVSHKEQPTMPPNQGKIADAKLELIRKWILGGALKDKGSQAQVKKQAGLEMTVPAGAGKPEGEPAMPEGVSRQPPVYTARPGAVTAIATSPWAPLAAIAGQQQIVLYHTGTAQLLGVLPFPEGTPFSLRFNRSGSLLLAGGGRGASLGIVAVYDVKTGKRAFQVGDELDVVLAADMNADNTLIALGGPQKIVRIYSTADGSLVAEIRKHTDWIYGVEFSPDGILLATADRSGGLWIWEAGTDREFYNLDGHKAPVTGISWRGDSNVLASASEDGTIKFWNMLDGKQIRSINAHGGGVASVHFTRDGRLASTGRDRVVKLWDVEGKQVRSFEPFADLGLEVALTHDGGRVIAGDWTGEIRMWETADGKLVAKLASNPPTLEMLLQSAQAKAAEAQAAADKAAAEAAEAQQTVAEKQKAADEAAALASQRAEDSKAAAANLQEAKATLAQATGDKQAAEKAVADAEATAKQAADAAAAAKAAAEQKAAEVEPAKKAWLEKALAAQLAAKAAEETRKTAIQIAAEKAAYDQQQKPKG